MKGLKHELLAYMPDHPVINTHTHHMPDRFFRGFDLDTLLKQTYVSWCGAAFGITRESRAAYLDRVRYHSCFVWLQRSLQELYGIEEALSADNWEQFSEMIETAHREGSFHQKILKDKCRYKRMILDTYWDPGSDNGRPELFSPAFRIDPLLYGYSSEATDHDGNSPWELYGRAPDNLADYMAWVRNIILTKKEQGCIALKCAAAYARDLEFESTPKEKAERVFLRNSGNTREQIRDFQNYLFQFFCETAAELGLPFQCHTGLGQLTGTRAMSMKDVIKRNPDTKFVLLHCSYPWTEDISGLIRVYPNVYPDLAWLPILSPTAAKLTLHELIEAGALHKVCWGCDTWTSEESFGALLAFRHVLAHVLDDKIKDGWISMTGAEKMIDDIMVGNASALYQFR